MKSDPVSHFSRTYSSYESRTGGKILTGFLIVHNSDQLTKRFNCFNPRRRVIGEIGSGFMEPIFHHTVRFTKPPNIDIEEDAVVFFTSNGDRFVFLRPEFDTMMRCHFDLYTEGLDADSDIGSEAVNYTQLLAEWNECTGYTDLYGLSEVKDLGNWKAAMEALLRRLESTPSFLTDHKQNLAIYCPELMDLGSFVRILVEIESQRLRLMVKSSSRYEELKIVG